MDMRGFDANSISDAMEVYGAAPGGVACLRGEDAAAQESIESGLYITWIPQSLDLIREQANRSRYERNEQCCRVSSISMCLCGHKLADHKEVNRKSSFIRPPKCGKGGCRCFGFSYLPSRPEECGQWWLPRRRDFDLKAWRKRVQAHPEEYGCIGCDLKITEHETLFETRQHRVQRGAPVDSAYIPLAETPQLQEAVLKGEHSAGRPR